MKCIRYRKYDPTLFEGINYSENYIFDHRKVAKKLKDKQPYTITVLIENLDPALMRRKDYERQERVERPSQYIELLYKAFYADFGEHKSKTVYRQWLDKYRPIWLREKKTEDIDGYIITNELEPRYKANILKRYSDYVYIGHFMFLP